MTKANMTRAKQTSSSRAAAPRLENFLCFAIYSANLAYGRAYKAILDELGLTYTQYVALVALSEEDNQTVSSLGEKLFLESNTLTPILKNLETMGYVRRQRDPKDERKVVISLTEAGRRVRDKALPLNLVRETQLTPEEFALLQKSVVKLRNNLIEGTKGTGKSK